jgi:hypothetical protein
MLGRLEWSHEFRPESALQPWTRLGDINGVSLSPKDYHLGVRYLQQQKESLSFQKQMYQDRLPRQRPRFSKYGNK